VRPELDPASAREAFDPPLPDDPIHPELGLDELVEQADPGITALGSPRYFGFVIGGTLPAALGVDWMVSTWDQNAGLAAITPSLAAIEELTGAWLIDLLGLPRTASFAFVTGCQMAHVTALAAARHRVLADAGWDVARDGRSAPPRSVSSSARSAT
jgi:glutamate/tyrosine decarboxylase-like PLP-dependent enzyme